MGEVEEGFAEVGGIVVGFVLVLGTVTTSVSIDIPRYKLEDGEMELT